MFQIIEIKRGKVTPGNAAFNNPAHRISLLELYVTSGSTVKILDEKFETFAEPVQVLDLPMIYFKDLDATVCKLLFFILFLQLSLIIN